MVIRNIQDDRTIAAMANPLSDRDREHLQDLLDAVPTPMEPLDVSMLDGYLVGVLLQPKPPPQTRWLVHVHDVDGRAPPPGVDLRSLHSLVLRRHAELADAIGRRQWFDPWIYELEEEAPPSAVVLPWVAGFAAAMEIFPSLMEMDGPELIEPLALIYAHLEVSDLEDADELIAEIETLEPPRDLAEAVESLVRGSLLLADLARPIQPSAANPRTVSTPGKRAHSRHLLRR